MSRTCSVCAHPESFEINEAIVVQKRSNRNIAKQFGLDYQVIYRHREHIPELLVKASQAMEVVEADRLLDQVRSLQRRALGILDRAEEAGDLRAALSAIREARGNLELLAKLVGELQAQPVTNIVLSPEWVTIRTTVVEALGPYPAARGAVSMRLLQLEGGVRANGNG